MLRPRRDCITVTLRPAWVVHGRAACCGDRPALLEWDTLDGWQRDNEFIVSGYRPTLTFRQCVASVMSRCLRTNL